MKNVRPPWPGNPPAPPKPKAFVDHWESLHILQGSAHGVSGEMPPRDLVAELHQVVAEVTGKPVPQPSKRIGFLE